jgi:hypothetical protein
LFCLHRSIRLSSSIHLLASIHSYVHIPRFIPFLSSFDPFVHSHPSVGFRRSTCPLPRFICSLQPSHLIVFFDFSLSSSPLGRVLRLSGRAPPSFWLCNQSFCLCPPIVPVIPFHCCESAPR